MAEGYYYIANSSGRKLSGHYPNDVPGRNLVFRRNDWYIFSTKSEAERLLKSITRHGYGKNLRILKGR